MLERETKYRPLLDFYLDQLLKGDKKLHGLSRLFTLFQNVNIESYFHLKSCDIFPDYYFRKCILF